MQFKKFGRFTIFIAILSMIACQKAPLNVDKQLQYCVEKVKGTLNELNDYHKMPRQIPTDSTKWRFVNIQDWTSGFWSGILWYTYEITKDEAIKTQADSFTMALKPLSLRPADNHDLGFMVFNSFGNGYRHTGNPEYKEVVLRTADTLATLFNPKVGTILSWPWFVKQRGWPHNTIIDNMMNLELLFWTSKNGGTQSLYDMAVRHAETTMDNHFRPDYSSYHVIVYDSTGPKIKGLTHQGYSDSSMWARGQAWGIYGYTMTYRETKKPEFLDLAQKLADIFIKRLPADYVPYWDFDAPNIPNEPKDASAAAVAASAMLEMAILIEDKAIAEKYRDVATNILTSLSSDAYLSGEKNRAFLLHSVGSKPHNSEVDVSIIYADYYYLEALLRLKKIQAGKSIYENL